MSQGENNRMVDRENTYIEVPQAAGLRSESLARIIWRSRWIVLFVTVVALGGAFAYLSKARPIYTSTSRIYVEQSGPRILEEAEGVMTQSKNYLYTQAELLKSTPILFSALEKPGVKQMKVFQKIDNPIIYLKKKGLNVSVGKKDDIISVSSDSPSAAEAAQLVNAVVDSYKTYHATRKRSTAGEVLKILRNEKVERDRELAQKLKAMMDFKKNNMALAFENRNSNIILDGLDRLSEAKTQAQLQTIEAKSAYETTKLMVTDSTKLKQFVETERAKGIHIWGANERTRLKTELEQLQFRLADLGRQVTPDHPSMQALQEKVGRIENELASMDREFAAAQLAITREQYLAAKEREEQISSDFEEQRRQALAFNEQLAQYTILQSDWEQTKKLCDILYDRIKEINVTEDVGALNINILEVARPSDKPSSPKKVRYMAIALFLGLMLGCGLALLRGWVDQRLRTAEEISIVLGVPVLGIVPSMSRRQSIVTRGQKVYQDSNSRAAEAYRTIRTAVFFGVPKGEAKTILVTSPAAADGKTTLVSNLGIALAQAGQKTLILDADFRKPMQHKIFEVNHEEIGLSSVLAGATSLEEAIRPTKVKGLELLTCGPDVPNPSEILNSESFAKVLEDLSNRYDRVIIDSPPVIPVTDSQILAAISDITLLVLRAEKSNRKIGQQARDGLMSVGARILGAVINDVSKDGRYGYYGYYSYAGRQKKKAGDKKPVAVMEGP
jgi:succinoglycan biosynthesis transport protein ExoP